MPIRNGTDFTKYFQRIQIEKWLQVLLKLPWLGNNPRSLCFHNTCADASDKYLCSHFPSCWKYLSASLRVSTDHRKFYLPKNRRLKEIKLQKLLLVYEELEDRYLSSLNQIHRLLKYCASYCVRFQGIYNAEGQSC